MAMMPPQQPTPQPQQGMPPQAPQPSLPQAPQNPNFKPSMFNGPIPGQGMTQPLGAAPYQQPPQFVHLDEFLEHVWQKINAPKQGVTLYGMLKAGLPAEAIAKTILFSAFTHGICTVSIAMLALPTVVRQIVALGHFLGVKKIKVHVKDIKHQQMLSQLSSLIDENEDNDDDEPSQDPQSSQSPPSTGDSIFSGLK